MSFSRRDFLKTLSSLTVGSSAFFMQPTQAALYNQNITELIQFIRGDLPFIICVPYGGNELVYGIPGRTNITRPVANFTFSGVVWTYEIAMAIRRTLQRLSGGKSPYMVLNLAHRRYLDVNREESDAFEVTLNAPRIYWEYHDMMREFINQMTILYDNPFLLEISGHQEMEDLMIRRTLNGKSVTRMTERVGQEKIAERFAKIEERILQEEDVQKRNFLEKKQKQRIDLANNPLIVQKMGHESFTGAKSLIGQLQTRGYKIDPELGVADIEIPQTTAGDFTLDRYGSHQTIGSVDAMQLVIGSSYRTTRNYMQTGRDIGTSLWEFAKYYGIISD